MAGAEAGGEDDPDEEPPDSAPNSDVVPGTACEIVNLRAIGSGAVPKPELPVGKVGDADASAAVVEEQQVVFGGKRVATKIYDRSKLEPGAELDGPAIVTEFDATTVVLPGYRAAVDENYNLLINPNT